MRKFISKEELKTIRPWLILAFLSISFYLIASNLLAVKNFVIFIVNLLQPLIIAIAFAYILNIPMTFIERNIKKISRKDDFVYKSSRGISVTLTIIFALIVVLLIGSILLPKIIESLAQLLSNMGVLLRNIATNIDELLVFLNIDYQLKDMAQVNSVINMPWEDIFKNVINVLANSANGLLSNAVSFTTVFFKWFMAFMFSLYMLNGKETLLRQLRQVCIVFLKKDKATQLFEYGKHANTIFKNFITGQLTEACIIATIYYIGMLVFGFPYPELIAMIIAVFSLVPVFGPICAMMIGIFLVMSYDIVMAIWFLVFFQVLSQIEDNLIYPRVVGKSVGLPGLWVMLSIFILGDLFGLVGMLVAVPVTAFVYTLFSRWIHKSLKTEKIDTDENGYVIEEKEK